jgi:peptidoglycan hydrolase CwlO-like protein
MDFLDTFLFSPYSGPIWAFLGVVGVEFLRWVTSRKKDRRDDLVAAAHMHASLNKSLRDQVLDLNTEMRRLREDLRATAAREQGKDARIYELEQEVARLAAQIQALQGASGEPG